MQFSRLILFLFSVLLSEDASDDSGIRVGGERVVEEDGKGMDDAEDDEGCDSKPRSDGLLLGTSSSSVITSNVFGPIWRNCKGGAAEERLSIGEEGG